MLPVCRATRLPAWIPSMYGCPPHMPFLTAWPPPPQSTVTSAIAASPFKFKMATAKPRKRHAVSALRDLADELGLHERRFPSDLAAADFDQLRTRVAAACTTSEQREHVADLQRVYTGALHQVPRRQELASVVPLPVAEAADASAGQERWY